MRVEVVCRLILLPRPFLRMVAMGLALAMAAGATWAIAADVPDPWQTYLDAAAAAATDGDDETVAVLLNAALQAATAEEPKGWRVAIADTLLQNTYLLLGKTEAAQRTFEAIPDLKGVALNRLDGQADAVGEFARAYLLRWHATGASDAEAERKRALIGAAAALYGFRATITLFRSSDETALAEARSQEGLAELYSRDFDSAVRSLKLAVNLWDALQSRHEILKAASQQLAPVGDGVNAMPSDLEIDIGDAQPYLAKMNLAWAFRHRAWAEQAKQPAAAIADYEAAITRMELTISQYDKALFAQTLRYVSYQALATFCRDEHAFRSARHETDLGPLIEKGRSAYSTALDEVTRLEGPHGINTLAIAQEYTKFLRNAGDEARAAEIEARYPQPKPQ